MTDFATARDLVGTWESTEITGTCPDVFPSPNDPAGYIRWTTDSLGIGPRIFNTKTIIVHNTHATNDMRIKVIAYHTSDTTQGFEFPGWGSNDEPTDGLERIIPALGRAVIEIPDTLVLATFEIYLKNKTSGQNATYLATATGRR